MSVEDQYSFEERQLEDGTFVRLTTDRERRLICEERLNRARQILEKLEFGESGELTGRTVYEQDGQRKPLRTTLYAPDGAVIWTQQRGQAPVISAQYQGNRPFEVRMQPKKG